MTDKPLDELAREVIGLAEKLPAGKWTDATGPSLHGSYHIVEWPNGELVCECYEGDDAKQAAQTAFIAAAKNTAPAIAHAYLEARALLQRFLDASDHYESDDPKERCDMCDVLRDTRAALHPQPDTTGEK